MIENKKDDEIPVPPGKEPEPPVEEPPRPRRGPHEVPDPPPIDDPRPPQPKRIVDLDRGRLLPRTRALREKVSSRAA